MTRILTAFRLWSHALLAVLVLGLPAAAAPFAAYVMDARTGQPIYKQNSDTRLHPASLTKMMTLYLAFTAIESGQVRLDSKFTVSSNAAAEPPSKLGLRAGQKIELRYLIRAAAIKSANDAATAIGEGIAGSEEAFAQRMTQMARALGMNNTQFRNANGLTLEGHYSTAHDMSELGRHLFYDFPQYYNLFSRRSADAGIAQVASTNRRFLDAYQGADGIKTGYTRAAGFNLTASAQRGNKRLIATVFGGTSTAHRNQVMAELLDSSFTRIPDRVREVRPARPRLVAQATPTRRAKVAPTPAATRPEPQRLVLQASPPPSTRPTAAASTLAAASPAMNLTEALQKATAGASAPRTALASSPRPKARPGSRNQAIEQAVANAVALDEAPAANPSASLAQPVLAASKRPLRSPRRSASIADVISAAPAAAPAPVQQASAEDMLLDSSHAPKPRSETVILAAMGEGDRTPTEELEVVRRPADSGRNWGIALGMYKSKVEAEHRLVSMALQDGAIFGGARRDVANTNRGFEPRFGNLTKSVAQLACDRLHSRSQECTVIAN